MLICPEPLGKGCNILSITDTRTHMDVSLGRTFIQNPKKECTNQHLILLSKLFVHPCFFNKLRNQLHSVEPSKITRYMLRLCLYLFKHQLQTRFYEGVCNVIPSSLFALHTQQWKKRDSGHLLLKYAIAHVGVQDDGTQVVDKKAYHPRKKSLKNLIMYGSALVWG